MTQEQKTKESRIDYDGLIGLYFPNTEETLFSDREEEWSAWSRFVDLLCVLRVMQKEADPPEDLDRIGCLPGDAALMKMLAPAEENAFPAWERLRSIFIMLMNKSVPTKEEPDLDEAEDGADGSDITAQASRVLPLGRVLSLQMLSPFEWMAFLLAVCIHQSRKYERVFSILQDQTQGQVLPTVGLAADLCRLFMTEGEADPSELLDPDSFLNRMMLEQVPGQKGLSMLSRALLVSRQALMFALDEDTGLGELRPFVREIPDPEDASYVCHEDALSELVELYSGMGGLGEDGIVFLEGEKGSGRRFLMEQLAAAAGGSLMILSMADLTGGGKAVSEEILMEIARRTFFRGEILYVQDFPETAAEQKMAADILSRLSAEISMIFVGGRKCHRDAFSGTLQVYLMKIGFPDMGEQKLFWNIFADDLGLRFDSDVEVDHLVSKYNMTPGRIHDTLSACRMHGRIEEDGIYIDKELIEREVRASSIQSFGEYATKLETAFSLNDLQLSKEAELELQKAMDRVRLRSIVNNEFGFGRKLPYGNGVSIVLYGPPGTGKTMTAQVLAKELGLDIYRIDLSQIESKYIGETEKNIGMIFETARYSNAILFFDEADALFAKRTDVSSSNDRHANAETAYLLQKIEEYSGVSILATNVFNNFDEAFKRRMTFLIPLRWPDEKERLALWKKIFPEETPLAEDINLPYYAQIGEMPGSGIKTCAVAAAYRAAAEGRAICDRDVMTAIEDEYKKNGRVLRLSLEPGDYSLEG